MDLKFFFFCYIPHKIDIDYKTLIYLNALI